MDMIEEAIAGQVSVSVTAGNVVLTTANNATDQSRPALLILTGTPGVTRTVTMPDVKKLTWVFNNSNASVILTSGAGTTVTLLAGEKQEVYSDGATNVALLSPSYVTGGSVTVTLGDGTNNFTMTTATLTYTKIANIVFFAVNCVWTSIGSAGASQLRITGLPIAITAGGGSFTFSTVDGLDTVGGTRFITPYFGDLPTILAFRTSTDNAASAALAANSCSATGKIVGAGFYFV